MPLKRNRVLAGEKLDDTGHQSKNYRNISGYWHNKNVLYANNPHSLKALKQNICEAVYNIQQCELQQVPQNLFSKKNSVFWDVTP
jgi:hypothetical protein